MKRSEIESAIARAKKLIADNNMKLPKWFYWNLDEWKANKDKLDTIRQCVMGWDVTDFGTNNFAECGATLLTVRNGKIGTEVGVPYCEKLIIMNDGQKLPLHFHFDKSEDIINRAGGQFQVQVYNSDKNGDIDYESDVHIWLDGIEEVVPAGTYVDIPTGTSMTMKPYMYHLFYAVKGTGDVIVGEVSKVNDDSKDNKFADENNKYASELIEDAPVTVPRNCEFDKYVF